MGRILLFFRKTGSNGVLFRTKQTQQAWSHRNWVLVISNVVIPQWTFPNKVLQGCKILLRAGFNWLLLWFLRFLSSDWFKKLMSNQNNWCCSFKQSEAKLIITSVTSVFPRLAPVTFFPALGHLLHVFTRLLLVKLWVMIGSLHYWFQGQGTLKLVKRVCICDNK